MNGKLWNRHLISEVQSITLTPTHWKTRNTSISPSIWCHTSIPPSSFPTTPFYIVDSGCSHNFIPKSYHPKLQNFAIPPINIHIHNHTHMKATLHTNISIAKLPNSATHNYIWPSTMTYGLYRFPDAPNIDVLMHYTSTMTLSYQDRIVFTATCHISSNIYIILHSDLCSGSLPITPSTQFLNHMSPLPLHQ